MLNVRYEPMLAKPADAFPSDLEAWVLEPKWDGWRTGIVITDEGATVYGGRNNATYNGKVPYIESALVNAFPPGTIIDGEMCGIEGRGWGSVQSVMTSKLPHHPSAAEPALTFMAFDLLALNGNDMTLYPWEERRAMLELLPWPEHTRLSPYGEATEAAHIAMIDNGMEGSMLKHRGKAYVPGQRSGMWLKLKAIASEDCEIINFEAGKNGRSGEVGAIVVRLPSGVETTASGMTDKVRADMLANPSNYLGKIVEIVHNGVMASGKLRHPRYKRMRDDKTPVVRPKPASAPRAGSARMRNYKAMGDTKLSNALHSLANCTGEAYMRANNDPNFSARQHYDAAVEAARARNMATPAFINPNLR